MEFPGGRTQYGIQDETSKKKLIVHSMQKSNLRMAGCPNTRLRRIDRLAQLPADYPVDCPSSNAYAECGKIAPYVGQCGCIVQPRPPADRNFEHAGGSKTVQNHVVRTKPVFPISRPRKLPSVPHTMATMGPGCMTMRPVQELPRAPTGTSAVNAAEKHWDWVLGPTLNWRTPFGGLHGMNWEVLLNNKLDKPETRTLKDRVVSMIWLVTNISSWKTSSCYFASVRNMCVPSFLVNFFALWAPLVLIWKVVVFIINGFMKYECILLLLGYPWAIFVPNLGAWVNTLEVSFFFWTGVLLEQLPLLRVFANYEIILPGS